MEANTETQTNTEAPVAEAPQASSNTGSSNVTLNDRQNNSSIDVNYPNLKKAALVLRAMNHKLRQEIVQLLDQNEKMTVTEIYVKLRLEQSVASQHLAILRRAGIVATKRDGKFIYYSVDYKRVIDVTKFVAELVG